MIHWESMTFSEIQEKWKKFTDKRSYNMKHNDPDFISVIDREKLINKLIEIYINLCNN